MRLRDQNSTSADRTFGQGVRVERLRFDPPELADWFGSAKSWQIDSIRSEQGKRTFRLHAGGPDVRACFVVKEFGARGAVDRYLLQHLRPGPGRRYPRACEAILQAGAMTPRVRFTAAEVDGGDRRWVGTEELQDAFTLGRVLTDTRNEGRQRVLVATGRAIRTLHRAGVFHFDLNEDNLLFVGSGDSRRGPFFVDLDYTVCVSNQRRRLRRLLARLDLWLFVSARCLELAPPDLETLAQGYAAPADSSPGEFPTRSRNLGETQWRLRTRAIHCLRGLLLVLRRVR